MSAKVIDLKTARAKKKAAPAPKKEPKPKPQPAAPKAVPETELPAYAIAKQRIRDVAEQHPIKIVKPDALNQAVMLVTLNRRKWGNRKVEESDARDTERKHGAAEGAFYTTKRLVAKDVITKVTSAFSRVKAHHYENTLPWLDDGARLLPAANYFTYVNKARELRDEALGAVDDLCKAWDVQIAAEKQRLGTAYRESDYPSSNALRQAYGID